ncbi:hypothetical protein KU75_22770 [Pectobacterium odoriferum]|uniref:Uncharacterized protein n=1 Tax=Pectobacterium odoriferum TaxID=78398 RepID=A0ABR4VJ81_9GAMM|nr:hypothetical protein KU75_22770 [Pectobacterium odoriferum]
MAMALTGPARNKLCSELNIPALMLLQLEGLYLTWSYNVHALESRFKGEWQQLVLLILRSFRLLGMTGVL